MRIGKTFLHRLSWVALFLPAATLAFMFTIVAGVARFPADSFLQGFRVSPVQISQQIPVSEFTFLSPIEAGVQAPFWDMALWNCEEQLSESNRTDLSQYESVWSNGYVSVRVLDAELPEVELTLDSLAIYNSSQLTFEQMRQTRPHFLLSRNFYPDTHDGMKLYGNAASPWMVESSIPDLNTLSQLTLTLKATLVGVEQRHADYPYDSVANWDKLYNRSAFSAYFMVYCRDPASESYGKKFWLGFMIYDSNLPYPGSIHYETDQLGSDGEGNYSYLLRWLSLYGADYQAILDDFHAGQETPVRLDVLDGVQQAIQALQGAGEFLDIPNDLSGLTVSHFNIGWEVRAPMRGTVILRDLHLNAVEGL